MAARICDNCNKEVQEEKRGSLTQWIFDESRCSCRKTDLKLSEDKAKNICPTCFNFKTSRRSGSMTQWIFRRYQCKCGSDSLPQTEKVLQERSSDVSTKSLIGEPEAEENFAGIELPFEVERYKPLRYIARSLLSVVYKCFDRQLDRLVAIKTLSFPDTETLIRFQEEARATALLKHPNIVEVLDFGIGDGGAAYMVLEFVEATNLEDWLATHGPFSEEETLAIISEVCRALDFAHRKGIYHRDLKPQNILLNHNRQPKLIDFGLALIRRTEPSLNDTHGLSLTGTPSYMSPDQFLGRPYDTRSEIYSIGCVLFACLTGYPPFHGENALDIANQHAGVEAPRLQTVNPGGQFSQRIQQLINRCLEKDPDLRYASVSELEEDLQALRQSFDGSEETKNRENSTLVSSSFEAVSDRPKTKSLPTKNLVTMFVAASVAILLAGGLTLTFLNLDKKQHSLPSVDEQFSVLPTPLTTDITDGTSDPATSEFDKKVESGFDNYLAGHRDKYHYAALLDEADRSRLNKNASDAVLYKALENYKACISLRRKLEPAKTTDGVLTRALLGVYDVNLRLRQFNELADVEKEIIKYSPGGKLTETAYEYFHKAADVYSKRNKPIEAARCLESAWQMWSQLHSQDGLRNVSLELNIGTTYLIAADWNNAKIWLERVRAQLEKMPPNRDFHIHTLLRLGVAYHGLKDFKTSTRRLQAAEKMALQKNDEPGRLLGQIYYRWAITLKSEGRLEEAENKLVKALSLEKNAKFVAMIQSSLDSVRKQRSQTN